MNTYTPGQIAAMSRAMWERDMHRRGLWEARRWESDHDTSDAIQLFEECQGELPTGHNGPMPALWQIELESQNR